MYFIAVLNFADISRNFRTNAISLLSTPERTRYSKYLHTTDADSFLFGRYITRQLIAQFTNLDPTEIDIVIDTDSGKPYIKDQLILFSISHSGTYVAVAISEKPIGIDLQIHNQTDFTIFYPYFTPEERLYADKSVDNFYTLWTSIEAVAKITSIGFNEALNKRIPHIHKHLIGYSLDNHEYFLQTIKTNEPTLSIATTEKVLIREHYDAPTTIVNALHLTTNLLKIYSDSEERLR